MMRVAIVDDEPLARLAVKVRLARHHADLELVAEYGDGIAAAGLAAVRPDLVFVDVQMPGKSGLDVLAALDYLLRPVDDNRLDEALDRARLALPYRRPGAGVPSPAPAWTRSFAVRVGARRVLVDAGDVGRIGADGDYATLHAGGRTYLVRERLQALALRLDPAEFQRVHRSAIVRLDVIAELRALTNRDALLRLRDGTLLRASRTYMPALTEAPARRTGAPALHPPNSSNIA